MSWCSPILWLRICGTVAFRFDPTIHMAGLKFFVASCFSPRFICTSALVSPPKLFDIYLKELVKVFGTSLEIGWGFIDLEMLKELSHSSFSFGPNWFSIQPDLQIRFAISLSLLYFENTSFFSQNAENGIRGSDMGLQPFFRPSVEIDKPS